MVTALGFAGVIWLIFLYSILYAALPNVEGSQLEYIEENKQALYRCNLDGTVKKPSSLVLNWNVDKENMEMTWDSNVTMIECSVDTPPRKCDYGVNKPTTTTCNFENVQLHQGATFIAKIQYLNVTLSDTIYFPREEMDGTAVENFSCVLYNVSFANCTWNAGRNAPEDVQYFLYMKNSKEYSITDRIQKRECPHYINNALRRHIGCHIPDVTFTSYYFYVNGSSKTSQIRYYDVLLNLCNYEKLGPPQNIIKNCSQLPPNCRIQWTPPLNNQNCRYTICYEMKNESSIIDLENKNFLIIDVEKRHIVRIRARRNSVYGEWSEPIILDPPSQSVPLPTLTLIFVVVGTILMILILVFICQRYHIWHKLTAPVPQPKDLFHQYTKNREKELGDPTPTAHEPDEKITFIEEVTDSFKNRYFFAE